VIFDSVPQPGPHSNKKKSPSPIGDKEADFYYLKLGAGIRDERYSLVNLIDELGEKI